MNELERELADTLRAIFEADQNYEIRYNKVFEALALASRLGYRVGIGFDDKTGKAWPVAYIELPTGQVSWHMPEHSIPYDGHSTAEKYLVRIAAYLARYE